MAEKQKRKTNLKASSSRKKATRKTKVASKSLPKAEQIPVVFHHCPEEENYKFPDKCVIKSCQYFTDRCANGCISLNKRENTKTISDQELLYYKFDKSNKMPVRNIGTLRRRAMLNVKRTVMLYYVLRHIEENFPEKEGLVYRSGDSPLIDTVINSTILGLKRMNFKPWMLKFIIDESTLEQVVKSLPIKGLGSDMSLKHILDLTPVKFRKLVQAVNTASSSQYREAQRLL